MSHIIEITVSNSGKYLICRVLVPITAEVARRMALEVQQFSEQTGIESRLVDVRGVRNVSSVSKNYDFGYGDLDEQGVARAAKGAVLVSPGDDSHDFALLVIRNSGFNARKFTDEAVAIAWLEDCDA
jgi:hypothetical protein